MSDKAIEFEHAISPAREMLCYETLWGVPSVELKTISELYNQYKALPSKLLKRVEAESLFRETDELFAKVTDFMQAVCQSHRFSIGVNGTFQYPARLRDAKYPLELFYYKGDIGLVDSPCISIVGSRKCSPEGAVRAKRLAEELVDRNFTIVSGLATGIDTAAMTAAVAAKGRTVGVIGTPLTETYPKENRALQERVAEDFLLVSQVPFYRYKHEPFNSRRRYFPQRNETMAALSKATVIVEAGETSGTLTQARACMQQGRKLFILNSCFESGLKWPHTYEGRGAIRVRTLDDILPHLPLSTTPYDDDAVEAV